MGVFCLQALLNLCFFGGIAGVYRLTSKQVQCHAEELQIASCYAFCLAVVVISIVDNCQHGIYHILCIFCHKWQQLILLEFSQHAVDVKMIKLQVEVGSYETGEIGVVVPLVDVEQLRGVRGHDSESLFSKFLT